MIVRLCEETPKLAIRIVETMCGGSQLMDSDIRLRIHKRKCRFAEKPRYYTDPCFNKIPIEPTQEVSIDYPAFEVDLDGRVVFYFDDHLWSQPSGRYDAHVIIGSSYCGLSFEIDLCNRRIEIDQAATVSQPPTPRGSVLC